MLLLAYLYSTCTRIHILVFVFFCKCICYVTLIADIALKFISIMYGNLYMFNFTHIRKVFIISISEHVLLNSETFVPVFYTIEMLRKRSNNKSIWQKYYRLFFFLRYV